MINPDDIQLEDLPDEYREVADRIGLKAALELVYGFAGCQLYVPKLETLARKFVYRQMYDDFMVCGNYKRVAVKHGLSESRTRQIIRDEQRIRSKVRETQGELF